jgi:hypothetical protein
MQAQRSMPALKSAACVQENIYIPAQYAKTIVLCNLSYYLQQTRLLQRRFAPPEQTLKQ